MKTQWGIDLGGTKIEGVILAPGSIEPILRHRIDTQADQGYEHVVSRIGLLLSEMASTSGIAMPDAIGIGTPGTVDPLSGTMKNCNTTALNGRPLPADLERALGRRVLISNDANCFALAEATLGAAKGYGVVFGVIMGTGVGGGIVVNGKVLNGAQGIAGEWGHNVLEPDGPQCYCGKRGCVETVLSGPALERWYEKQSGSARRLHEIVEMAGVGDVWAEATIDRLVDYFGRALSVVVNILDPDAIVLGGGVANVEALYDRGMESVMQRTFNSSPKITLLKPSLGDSAGVFGAAGLLT